MCNRMIMFWRIFYIGGVLCCCGRRFSLHCTLFSARGVLTVRRRHKVPLASYCSVEGPNTFQNSSLTSQNLTLGDKALPSSQSRSNNYPSNHICYYLHHLHQHLPIAPVKVHRTQQQSHQTRNAHNQTRKFKKPTKKKKEATMAMQAHALGTFPWRNYRRVACLPITGANVGGKVSLCGGDKDLLILGTIAGFGPQGWSSLNSNFGPINTVAAAGNTVGPPASTAATASTVNGVTTVPTPSTASIPLTTNGAVTGHTLPTASTAPTTNTAISTISTAPTANTAISTVPTALIANGATDAATLNFTPFTIFATSNHGLPYELTDLLVSFKECKGIFKCIREMQSNTFAQLAIVSLNSHMREALKIPPTSTVAYPIAHIAGTLTFDRDGEVLALNITWIIDHIVEFKIEASTSRPLW